MVTLSGANFDNGFTGEEDIIVRFGSQRVYVNGVEVQDDPCACSMDVEGADDDSGAIISGCGAWDEPELDGSILTAEAATIEAIAAEAIPAPLGAGVWQ